MDPLFLMDRQFLKVLGRRLFRVHLVLHFHLDFRLHLPLLKVRHFHLVRPHLDYLMVRLFQMLPDFRWHRDFPMLRVLRHLLMAPLFRKALLFPMVRGRH